MLSVANLQAWLRVSGDDAILSSLEARAVAFLETQTGRYFRTPAEVVEILNGQGDDVLFLAEQADLAQAFTVETYDGSNWVAVDAADYEVENPSQATGGARVYRIDGEVWPEGRRNVRATYTRGYAPLNQPDDGELDGPGDIVQATLDLVALKYRQRGEEGHSSAGVGGFSYSLADVEAIPGLSDTLEAWRRVSV